jgi:hypothetical protein
MEWHGFGYLLLLSLLLSLLLLLLLPLSYRWRRRRLVAGRRRKARHAARVQELSFYWGVAGP